MGTNSKFNLGINLTGDSDLDRHNIFNYIIENFTKDKTEAEILVLAATFLGKDTKTIFNEIRVNPEVLVPVCLYLMSEEKIALSRRNEIGNALLKYTDAHARKIDDKATRKPLYNFTLEYEKALYTKMANSNVEDILVTFPFYRIYYTQGLIYEAMADYTKAFVMYSKAHQWNPFNPKPILKILEGLKYDGRAQDLLRLSMWYLQITYSAPNISAALRYAGYALYLDGKFAEAYAFYYQAIVYQDGETPARFNEEITSVLTALKKDAPYELSRAQIKKLFAYSKFKPYPSEIAFDTIRPLIINHYTKGNYVDAIRYATQYVIFRPNDDKIMRILKASKLNLD
ncbi:MAG TPA: hypothetical protein PK460_01865 [Bacilli bacterium]|nr:hypothetical protein [Bacilli bacterium]HPY78768.1 hypothetical protein [Bacilli bacterium]HQB96592.1 hypothetical protein [Bacilli bacterium]